MGLTNIITALLSTGQMEDETKNKNTACSHLFC